MTRIQQINELANNGCTGVYCGVCPAYSNSELCDALRHITTKLVIAQGNDKI